MKPFLCVNFIKYEKAMPDIDVRYLPVYAQHTLTKQGTNNSAQDDLVYTSN